MRLRPAARVILSRFRRPAIWGSCLAWVALTMTDYLVTEARGDAARYGLQVPIANVLNNFMDGVICSVLSPFAWQWTGDQRPIAPLGRGLLQSLAVTVLGFLTLKLPLGWFTLPNRNSGPDPLGPALFILVGLAVYLVAAAVGRAITWGEHQQELRREALARAQEAQWTLLRSQLSPHLVLNVLNGMAGLTEENPAKAARGLLDLAEVYQQLIALGEADRIPLARERELLISYLGVEQLRLEAGLEVTWRWDDRLNGERVPPLLLQPLVENAIKHGINASPGGGRLIIEGSRQGCQILLQVSNTGGRLGRPSPQAGPGVGLRNLRQRLQLAYAEGASLSFSEDGPWTRATVIITAASPPAEALAGSAGCPP